MIYAFEKNYNRKIRIFISSPFKGMDKERDILVNSVFPRLRLQFKKSMIDIMEIDLRWGIPNEDSFDVLEICLGEVLRCFPYFIGIVGDYYGSPVDTSKLNELPFAYRQAVGENIPKFVSLTELEFRAGAFTRKNSAGSCFFIRSDSSEKTKSPELENLIQEIKRGYSNYSYITPDQFEKVIYKTLEQFINQMIPDIIEVPYGDNDYISHLTVLKANTNNYVPNIMFISKLIKKILEGRFLYLYGKKGTGKSACMSWLIYRLGISSTQYYDPQNRVPEIFDYNVFFHFATAGDQCLDLNEIFKRLRFFLAHIEGQDSDEENDYDAVIQLLSKYDQCNDKRLILFFDAVETYHSVTSVNTLFQLGNLNKLVSVVCSGTEKYLMYEQDTVEIEKLTSGQINLIVEGTLKDYGKRLSGRDKKRIINKKQNSNPLFLNTLLSQIRMFGIYDELELYLDKLLSSEGFEKLFRFVINRLEDYFKDYFDVEYIYKVLALIHYSYKGVTEAEIQEITKILPIAKSVLLTALDSFTIEDNGLIRFNHDLISNEVELILKERNTYDYKSYVSNELINYFNNRNNSWREYCELPYQYFLTGQHKDLLNTLCNKTCFMYLAKFEKILLVNFLQRLLRYQYILANKVISKDNSFNIIVTEIFNEAGAYNGTIQIVENSLSQCKEEFERIRLLEIGARAQYKIGKYRFAIEAYKELLQEFEKYYPDDEIGYASRAYLLGVTYKTSGDINNAFPIIKESADILRRKNVHSATAAWVYDVYGISCYYVGKIYYAVEIFGKSIELCELLFGPKSDEMAWAYSYGWPSLYAYGEIENAKHYIEDAYTIYKNMYRGAGTKFAWAAINYGSCELMEKHYQRAEELLKIGIYENDIILEEEKRPHPYSLTTYCILAILYEESGDHSSAISTIEFALNESKNKNGKHHFNTANILMCSGIIKNEIDEIQDALYIYDNFYHVLPDRFFAMITLSRLLSIKKCDSAAIDMIYRCKKEYFSEQRETKLITYLIYETLGKVCGEIHPEINELYMFEEYEYYLTHNNSSNILPIVKL